LTNISSLYYFVHANTFVQESDYEKLFGSNTQPYWQVALMYSQWSSIA
jgi:hypothetical protein